MRVEFTEEHIVVTLSRRNLLALLHKVDQDWSAKTIGSSILLVRAEPDEEHYADRPEPPGPMHPKTEGFIRRNG